MHRTIDSSQIHGTQPDSEDSTPSAGLYVRLLTPVNFLHIRYLAFLSFSLPFYSPLGLKKLTCVLTTQSWRANGAHYTWGLLIQKLNIINFRASRSLHMCPFSICTFSSPLYASIWLKFWPSWGAWLLCLCPTFSLIRLGHKGSTSVILTAGYSGCVPQTAWSRKLVFLREYSVGEQKMFLSFITT